MPSTTASTEARVEATVPSRGRASHDAPTLELLNSHEPTLATHPAAAADRPRARSRSDDELIKRAVRSRIRAERRARTPEQLASDAQATAVVVLELPEIAAARCVALYASVPGEPGTEPLREALRRSGRRVLLPLVRDDGRLDWAEDDGELLETTKPGGPEPIGPTLGPDAVRRADVLLIPALAVDTLGNRLGQGAGYYDRTLPLLDPWVPVLAIVHDGEVLDAAIEPVPAEPHDVPVDAIVTPHRCLRITHHRAPHRATPATMS